MVEERLRALERQLQADPSEELEREYERQLVLAGRVEDALVRREGKLRCLQAWPQLRSDPRGSRLRQCDACAAEVRWVESAAEARRYAARGHNVAGPARTLRALVSEDLERAQGGEPASPRPPCFLVQEEGPESLPHCGCLHPENPHPRFHTLLQDTECVAWHRLLDLVDQAAREGRQEFSPAMELSAEEWSQIVTLPASIAQLSELRVLMLYGSSLVRLPPEVAALPKLEALVTYTSYRLHWYPYELTRSASLRDSTVSTRALYGNFKNRPGFPDLTRERGPETGACSVCERPCSEPLQRWISLRVATDVLPLLVNACSEDCLARLPTPPEGYVDRPHQGGPGLRQPSSYPPRI